MSLIRALSKELQARSDDSLRALFSARPDLISPGVPDFAALAARASGRVSVQRALERLNRPEMQVLETLHLCTNTDTGHSASAAMLKKLINGSTLASIEKMLHSLQELALVHRAEPPHGAPGRRREAAVLLAGGQPQGRDRHLSGRAGTQLHRTRAAPAGFRAARGPARRRNCTAAARRSRPRRRRWRPRCRCSTGRPRRSPSGRSWTPPRTAPPRCSHGSGTGPWAPFPRRNAAPPCCTRPPTSGRWTGSSPAGCWCRWTPPTWSCRTASASRCAAALSSRSLRWLPRCRGWDPPLPRCAAMPPWARSPRPCGWSVNCSMSSANSPSSPCAAAAWASGS